MRYEQAVLQATVKADPLTAQEERDLCANGLTKRVQDELVRRNTRYAVQVAGEYQHLGLPLEDLISEALVGLVTASKRFDPTLGNRFISYATHWIRQSVRSALEKEGTVRYPSNVSDDARRLMRWIEQDPATRTNPTVYEVSRAINVTTDAAQGALSRYRTVISLDREINEENRTTLEDLVDYNTVCATLGNNPPFDAPDACRYEDLEQLEYCLSALPKRERSVVEAWFGIGGGDGGQQGGDTLATIGKREGFSRERARQIKERAIGKMRRRAQSRLSQAQESAYLMAGQ